MKQYDTIHLPVSPSCNIQCRFCKRGFSKRGPLSGVSTALLSPTGALTFLDKALLKNPAITAVDIAGPGDTLASPHAIETFRLVHEKYPDLINCLSTNGLMLREKIEILAEVGVRMVTVAVNAVAVPVLAQICAYIIHDNQYLTGEMAARWLILAQLAGIRKAAEAGIAVKINTVLVPGINDDHISEVAKITAQAGAKCINIIPLIPEYDFSAYRAPTVKELTHARNLAQQYLPVFEHTVPMSATGGHNKTLKSRIIPDAL